MTAVQDSARATVALLHQGRNNNFNLIRFLAALTVLIAHPYPLAGAADIEPLRGRFGMSIGTIAVHVFFVTSGFLVTESLLRVGSVKTFLASRFLRIYPALIASVFAVTYLLGPTVTSLPVAQYLWHPDTHQYFLKSATLLAGIGWVLPGVFGANPFRDIVNGSLWTLPYEVHMYLALALLWLIVAAMARPDRRLRHFTSLIVVVLVVSATLLIVAGVKLDGPSLFVGLTYMFCSGSVLYLLRERVSLSPAPLLIAGAVALPCVLFHQTLVFQLVYLFALPYAVVLLALVPRGKIRLFNQFGDYFYGLYIYAFPIQQTLAYAFPALGPRPMLVASALITLLVAIASWHLIERPALQLKHRL